MRSSLVLLTALVLALTVGACGRQPATDVSPPAAAGAPSTLPDGMGSGADDGVFPRTIGHFAGTTTIETAPVRVVVLSTGQLDGLLSVGVVPVGTTTARGAALVPAYLTTAFPEQRSALAAMSTLGTRAEPDVEAVAATDPDLILTNSTVDAAGPGSARLDRAGGGHRGHRRQLEAGPPAAGRCRREAAGGPSDAGELPRRRRRPR